MLGATSRFRVVLVLLLMAAFVAASTPSASAHRDGCHAQHSCPSDTGSYVCGDTGNFSECGYSSLPEAPEPEVQDYDAPARPVTSKPKSRAGGKVGVTIRAERGSTLVVRAAGRTLLKTVASGSAQSLMFKGVHGTRRYVVRATDAAGNASTAATFRATADAAAPSVSDVEIERGTAKDAYSRLSFAPGEFAKYTVSIDGRPVTSGKAVSDQNELAFPVPNGRHTVELKLVDGAGNVSTVARKIAIDVPRLAPVVETLADPNSSLQRFAITGTPDSRGTLTIGGEKLPVHLVDGETEVAVDLPDGAYPAGTLRIRDELGRVGRVAVPPMTVDTIAPALEVARRDGASLAGRLIALITAEEGARVAWRVLDEDGIEIEHATYTADGQVRTIDVDAKEGRATLEVEAADEAGNSSADDFAASIDSDPLTMTDWLVILTVMLVLISLAFLGWRRRSSIISSLARARRGAAVRKARIQFAAKVKAHTRSLADHATRVAAHDAEMSSWTARQAHLTQLREEARSAQGVEDGRSAGVRLKRGERLYMVCNGSLVEHRTRQNVPTLVTADSGRVAITNLRVVFFGPSKKRDWNFDKLEQREDVREDMTLIRVSNRKTLSGVRYSDPERFRLYLELALHPSGQTRQRLVENIQRELLAHSAIRPAPPAEPPAAPEPPAILRESGAEASVAPLWRSTTQP